MDTPIQSIKFEQVEFAYNEKRVLQDINVEIQAGECMAFVGGSGAGKTTLVNMVPRFFDPNQGALRINGVDLRDYTLMSLREQVGVVTQDTVLFNRSVADNIAYGVPSATREDIVDARSVQMRMVLFRKWSMATIRESESGVPCYLEVWRSASRLRELY